MFLEHDRHRDDEAHSTQPDRAVLQGTHSFLLRKYSEVHEVQTVAEVHVVQPGSASVQAGGE